MIDLSHLPNDTELKELALAGTLVLVRKCMENALCIGRIIDWPVLPGHIDQKGWGTKNQLIWQRGLCERKGEEEKEWGEREGKEKEEMGRRRERRRGKRKRGEEEEGEEEEEMGRRRGRRRRGGGGEGKGNPEQPSESLGFDWEFGLVCCFWSGQHVLGKLILRNLWSGRHQELASLWACLLPAGSSLALQRHAPPCLVYTRRRNCGGLAVLQRQWKKC